MGIHWGLIYSELGNLFTGAGWTLFITVIAVAIGAVLGLVIAILRLSPRWWLHYPATAYIEALRGTPMLVQILLFYYGIFPGIQDVLDYVKIIPPSWLDLSWIVRAAADTLPGIASFLGEAKDGSWLDFSNLRRLPAIYSGIVALGLNSGAYLGEIFRGGIQSIDRGQREAALSLGMTNYQVMRYVVLPQALANALPAICNEFITMIKDSSLVAIIAVPELTYRAMLVAARKYEYFTMYVGIALVYFVMTFTTSRVLAWVEKKMRVGQTAADAGNRKRQKTRTIVEGDSG